MTALVQIPALTPIPDLLPFTNSSDPKPAEVDVFRASLATWGSAVLAQVQIYDPNQVQNITRVQLPGRTSAPTNATAIQCFSMIQQLMTWANQVNTVYTTAHHSYATHLVSALGQNLQQAINAFTADLNRPQIKLPEPFTGKTAAAHYFMTECNNYAAIVNFRNDEQRIRWALQLMEGDAKAWCEKQFDDMKITPLPNQFTTWGAFQAHFEGRWLDGHEAERALDRLLKGEIFQRTSVKEYNDAFNELLGLTLVDGSNPAVLRRYIIGLKTAVRTTAIAPLDRKSVV